jgi:hypothetical protein
LLIIDGSIMTLVVLIGSIVATISGITRSASIIIEADGLFPQSPVMNESVVQGIKKTKIMPKLWAPMLETFIGEAILFIALISGVAEGDGFMLLALIVAFFMVMILVLARHFYRAGRSGNGNDEDIR